MPLPILDCLLHSRSMCEVRDRYTVFQIQDKISSSNSGYLRGREMYQKRKITYLRTFTRCPSVAVSHTAIKEK